MQCFLFQILYQRVNFQIHPEGENISVSPLAGKVLQEVRQKVCKECV